MTVVALFQMLSIRLLYALPAPTPSSAHINAASAPPDPSTLLLAKPHAHPALLARTILLQALLQPLHAHLALPASTVQLQVLSISAAIAQWVHIQLGPLFLLPARHVQSDFLIQSSANKHASPALQENTARLKDSQLPAETALWALFPPATLQPPTAPHVYRASTAALQGCRHHLAIVLQRHFQGEAPKPNLAHLALLAPPVQLSERPSALPVRPDSRPPQVAHLAKRSSMKKSFSSSRDQSTLSARDRSVGWHLCRV